MNNRSAQLITPSTAFIFDLNGTMIDDMRFHNEAWHKILTEDLGSAISFADTKKEMYGKNSELLIRVFGEGRFTEEEMDALSLEKERRYQQAFFPHLQLINGLGDLLEKAHRHHIPMAIGSAAIPYNINFVLDNLQLRKYITVVVSADDVKISKPDPETFLKAAQQLGVKPEDCIVFEDSPKGTEAAGRAGMRSIVLTTMHEAGDFDGQEGLLGFIKDYTDPFILELFEK